jgi:YggT family protein
VTVVLATVRGSVADYISALLLVYTLIMFAYIIMSLVLSFGVRIPYNRGVRGVLDFLREVCEPYLRIFRRFLPNLGPFDLSPMVGILVLQIGGNIVIRAVQG